ncbi:MAG: ABC transporter ATP-binding protein [Ferruginibacter sp.]
MDIILTNTGKRYNREWIFRHINYSFKSPNHYAITGANGSGKSTLLQVIAGAVLQSEGNIEYAEQTQPVMPELAYKEIAFCAPYLDLIEELTGLEFLQFHKAFKPLKFNETDILQQVGLAHAAQKQIRYYSSGMKQRLKMAQAFFSMTPVLFLDEPTSNLDEEGIALYRQLISTQTKEKLVIISSNEKHEYESCGEMIEIANYKI